MMFIFIKNKKTKMKKPYGKKPKANINDDQQLMNEQISSEKES